MTTVVVILTRSRAPTPITVWDYSQILSFMFVMQWISLFQEGIINSKGTLHLFPEVSVFVLGLEKHVGKQENIKKQVIIVYTIIKLSNGQMCSVSFRDAQIHLTISLSSSQGHAWAKLDESDI